MTFSTGSVGGSNSSAGDEGWARIRAQRVKKRRRTRMSSSLVRQRSSIHPSSRRPGKSRQAGEQTLEGQAGRLSLSYCVSGALPLQVSLARRERFFGDVHRASPGRGEPLRKTGLRHRISQEVWRQAKPSGRGAVWLARLNGVQEVAGSNPVAPTS